MRPADFRSNSVSFREKGRRDLARAASVLLKSFPKKGTHDDDIPLSLRMSGQFCTSPNRLAQLPIRRLLDNLREGGLADRLFAQDYLRYGDFTPTISCPHPRMYPAN